MLLSNNEKNSNVKRYQPVNGSDGCNVMKSNFPSCLVSQFLASSQINSCSISPTKNFDASTITGSISIVAVSTFSDNHFDV